nr:MAG TPA: hypothetical protein [Caudoviricetes sp.]
MLIIRDNISSLFSFTTSSLIYTRVVITHLMIRL